MSLFAALARAKTEVDVKDAYIKALGLKSFSKNLVDIQTQEVWFEAKSVSTPPIVMFAQLLFSSKRSRMRSVNGGSSRRRPFKAAYAALGAKLRPLVFEHGFLPE